MAELLSVSSCLSSTTGVLILYIIVVVSLFFVVAGLTLRNGFFGLIGGLMLLISSLYLAPCLSWFAYIVALLSLLFVIYFGVGMAKGGNSGF